MAMWENVAIAVFVAIVFGIAVWRSFRHGELGQLIGFFKVASKVNNDLFGGETKTFVLDRNGEEKPVEIKTVSDALNLVFSRQSPSGKLYFGPQRAGGLHLEFNVFSQYDDDFMRFIEKEGEEVLLLRPRVPCQLSRVRGAIAHRPCAALRTCAAGAADAAMCICGSCKAVPEEPTDQQERRRRKTCGIGDSH